MLNTTQLQQDGTMPTARFFSGDWKDFVVISTELSANKNKYDCILTSETIYNPENYQKLLSIFKACLGAGGVMYPLKLYF
jgi:predicted nicotinamide N-methyase